MIIETLLAAVAMFFIIKYVGDKSEKEAEERRERNLLKERVEELERKQKD